MKVHWKSAAVVAEASTQAASATTPTATTQQGTTTRKSTAASMAATSTTKPTQAAATPHQQKQFFESGCNYKPITALPRAAIKPHLDAIRVALTPPPPTGELRITVLHKYPINYRVSLKLCDELRL